VPPDGGSFAQNILKTIFSINIMETEMASDRRRNPAGGARSFTPDERRDNQEGLLRELVEEARQVGGERAEELRRQIRREIHRLGERRDSYEKLLRGLIRETDERRDTYEE
jgi:hypothetical protein